MIYNVVIIFVYQNVLNHYLNAKWENGLPNLAVIGSDQ